MDVEDDEMINEEDLEGMDGELEDDDESDIDEEELAMLEALKREHEELLSDLQIMKQSIGVPRHMDIASLQTNNDFGSSSNSAPPHESFAALHVDQTNVSSSSSYFESSTSVRRNGDKIVDRGNEVVEEGGDCDDDGSEEGEMSNVRWTQLFVKRLAMSSPRILVTVLWFWLLSTLHFSVMPLAYVRNSMVNSAMKQRGGEPVQQPARYSAMQDFFRSEGHVGLFPRPRVFMTLVVGVIIAFLVVIFTGDEFLFGPPDPDGERRQLENNTRIERSVDPVEIYFENLGCTVAGQKTPILKNVTGVIPPAQITGILGPSGAGKSTFAAGLLGRGERECESSYGSVYLNAERRSLNAILDRVGFVPQHDDLFEHLTVEETLRFSAAWRLPWYLHDSDRELAVNETLKLLDLEHIRHERIGGLMNRGISGGEKKRVSIGVELIMNPSVLVMDEPTSGLDGAAAFKLLKRLRHIVDTKGVSVVVVLHVPAARVFKLLDNLILLQHGELAYAGPCSEVTSVMAQMGFNLSDSIPQPLRTGGQAKEIENRSSTDAVTIPEFLLDVLAGVVPYPPDICPYKAMLSEKYEGQRGQCQGKETIPMRWRRIRSTDRKFQGQRQSPFSSYVLLESLGASGRMCMANSDSTDPQTKHVLGFAEQLYKFLNSPPPGTYNRVAKPGLVRQVSLWLILLVKLRIRRGIILEFFSCLIIGVFCAWVRSYSKGWDSRAMAAFFVSVSLAAHGSFAAVFEDNVRPVKRAAESGMVLGAHHNAMVLMAVAKGFIISNVFTTLFHLTLWLRTNDVRVLYFRRHCALVFITMMAYIANWSIATLLCVHAEHKFQASAVYTIGYMMWTHVFAMYSPNARQIHLDSLVFEKYKLSKGIRLMCSMSPARYFLEAFTVWDSDPRDPSNSELSANLAGRTFMLNYFGYRDENLSTCLSILFVFFLSVVIIRWALFGYVNSTDFHTLYDTPLFAKFFLKLHLSMSLSLSILITLHREKQACSLKRNRRANVNKY